MGRDGHSPQRGHLAHNLLQGHIRRGGQKTFFGPKPFPGGIDHILGTE